MGIITGCNGENANQTKTTTKEGRNTELESVEIPDSIASRGGVAAQTAIDIAGLRQADSVQVLFYNDPYGKDSLRYARFFKHYNTSDTAIVNPLLKGLDQLFSVRNEVLNCRSEGKLFFFKGGKELKTVYFNTGGKAKAIKTKLPKVADCAFLYFIKDGVFIYLPIQSETVALLQSLKPKAVNP